MKIVHNVEKIYIALFLNILDIFSNFISTAICDTILITTEIVNIGIIMFSSAFKYGFKL